MPHLTNTVCIQHNSFPHLQEASSEMMRYRDAPDETKTLWINDVREWGAVNDNPTPVVGAVTWFDEGSPWAVFNVEDVVYNADVREYIQAKGP